MPSGGATARTHAGSIVSAAANPLRALAALVCVRAASGAASDLLGLVMPHNLARCHSTGWTLWSSCSTTCGRGSKVRYKMVPDNCPPGSPQVKGCTLAPCPKVDCDVAPKLLPWSKCSKTCGAGTQFHDWVIRRKPAFGGRACPGPALRKCNTQHCPIIDCQVGAWGTWSGCTHTCGTGSKLRHRAVKVWDKNGGKKCPKVAEMKICDSAPCEWTQNRNLMITL